MLADLVAEAVLSPECAVRSQIELYSASGKVAPPLVDAIDPEWLVPARKTYDKLRKATEK
jgi:hypothetical protein